MTEFLYEGEPGVKLYRDTETGIAWIEDGRVGLGISIHPNIDESGCPEGMITRGYWGENDRLVKSHGWIYNTDRFVCNENDKLERIVANACMCEACMERRSEFEEADSDKIFGVTADELLKSILNALPPEPRNCSPDDDPGFWTDGEEILCPSETECEIVADFLEDLFREKSNVVIKTGYYDPNEDSADGLTDDHTGFYYISFN